MKKVISIIAIMASAMLISACNSDSSSSGGQGQPKGSSKKNPGQSEDSDSGRDSGDSGDSGDSSDPQDSIINTRWYKDFAGNDVRMRLTFQFSLTTVTLTNHCTYPNFPEGFKVEVRSTADVDPSRINIHTPQQKTGKKRNGPTDYECNVSLQQGTIDYKMNGNSLTIYDRHTGEELILKRL